MIKIKRSNKGDTRTCDFTKVALEEFTKDIGREGHVHIMVSANRANILLVGYEQIYGIVILENISIDEMIINIISHIIKEVYNEAKKE